MTTLTKVKKFTYSPFHSFKIEGKEHCMQSQLYQIGVYVIYDNNSSYQGGATPSGIVKLQRRLRQAEMRSEITDLQFSIPIKVAEVEGFWKQINEEE
jgi:hypothetical protein